MPRACASDSDNRPEITTLPTSLKVISPESNNLSKFGLSNKPFIGLSLSTLSQSRHGFICDATNKLQLVRLVTAQPPHRVIKSSLNFPCPILLFISVSFSVLVRLLLLYSKFLISSRISISLDIESMLKTKELGALVFF